jgi:organic hydroperoxide reductase OsmC/OhrA
MSVHVAIVSWARGEAAFTDRQYDRRHLWSFDGGAEIAAAASPANVRVPLTDPAGVDPEEAFAAAVSSCHMLWFLDFAARAGFRVDTYVDHVEAHCAKNAEGRDWVDRVVLRPEVVFSGDKSATEEDVDRLHHQAHQACHIANSVRSEIVVDGSFWNASEDFDD